MLKEKVLKTIKKYDLIKNGDNVVVGVSGGPDSMSLLNILIDIKKDIDFDIVVAHINHGIRAEADEETKYVENFCSKKNIKCYIDRKKVEEIAKDNKIGTEEAGRKLRYEFFKEVSKLENANKVATAHNANDNAETVLMNLIRGCSTTGLKGIEVKRDNFYIRPLIECSRDEIEEYCENKKLNPKYDKSNNENIYTRNKIRNLLIPYLKDNFNPQIVDSINRLSELATMENDYLDKVVEKEYNRIKIDETLGNKELKEITQVQISLKEFNKLDLVIKNRLVLYTISKLFGSSQNIERVHIRDIIKLCENNIGNKYLLPNKNTKVFVGKGKIFFIKNNTL